MKRTTIKRRGRRRFRNAVVDPGKIKWIRSLPCACYLTDGLYCEGPVEAHHEPPGNRSDDRVIPLCAVGHHREGTRSRHQLGREGFEHLHGFVLLSAASEYERLYREQRGS